MRQPLAMLAEELAGVLYRLSREWESVEEEIDDPDKQTAFHVVMADGYPLGRDLNEVAADAGEWAEHVDEVMRARPTVLHLVTRELGEDIDRVTADLTATEPGKDPEDTYRSWQNGGLGGDVGRFGGIFTPALASDLRDLLTAIDAGDTERIPQAADRLARNYRVARSKSQA